MSSREQLVALSCVMFSLRKHILSQRGGSAPWFGTVRLWTSGPSCLSCVRAMRQLRQIFPGLCLEVAHNSEGGEADGEN